MAGVRAENRRIHIIRRKRGYYMYKFGSRTGVDTYNNGKMDELYVCRGSFSQKNTYNREEKRVLYVYNDFRDPAVNEEMHRILPKTTYYMHSCDKQERYSIQDAAGEAEALEIIGVFL